MSFILFLLYTQTGSHVLGSILIKQSWYTIGFQNSTIFDEELVIFSKRKGLK